MVGNICNKYLQQKGGNICKQCIEKGLISRIYKELIQLNSKINKNEQRTSIDFSQIRWTNGEQAYEKMLNITYHSVPFSSVTQSCSTLCDPMDCSTPGLLVHCQLPKFTQTHVLWVGDATQPSHSLTSPPAPAFNLFQHQGLFQWVSSLHQVAKVLELQLQHQSFQWMFRTDFL